MPTKRKKIEVLLKQAALFRPGIAGRFVCPTCLKDVDPFPKEGKKSVDVANIIPEAGGGRGTTLTCSRCNNDFGRKQDAWLVDYLKAKSGDVFAASRRKGFFEVDGLRVNGDLRTKGKGSLSLRIHLNRNSPDTKQRLAEIFRRYSPERRVRIPAPLELNKRFIYIGLLTAGYLAWFEASGYSWVLQKHLDPVREQIQNADSNIIPTSFIQATEKELCNTPVIGAIFFEEMILPAVAYLTWIIIFPSPHHPDAYAKLRPNMVGRTIRFQEFQIPRFSAPTALSLSYRNAMIVLPDRTEEIDARRRVHLLYQRDQTQPVLLFPTTDDEIEDARRSGYPIIDVDLENQEIPLP